MEADKFPTLSSKKEDLVYVVCVDCELLRKLDYQSLFDMYGDADLFELKGRISKDIIECGKEIEGYHNRCRLRFFDGYETKTIKLEKPSSPKLEYLCSWEIIVAKCQYCGHVSNLESWRVRKITKPGMTLDDLSKRLKCKKHVHKSVVKCTIAKLPR